MGTDASSSRISSEVTSPNHSSVLSAPSASETIGNSLDDTINRKKSFQFAAAIVSLVLFIAALASLFAWLLITKRISLPGDTAKITG